MILRKKARVSNRTKTLAIQLLTHGTATKKVNRPVHRDKLTG